MLNDKITFLQTVQDFDDYTDFHLEQERPQVYKICGYDTLPRQIADEFIALGGVLEISDAQTTQRKVVKVERTLQDGVQVTTQDGRIFSGRSAVCTFSVGMLDPDTGEGNTIFGELLSEVVFGGRPEEEIEERDEGNVSA